MFDSLINKVDPQSWSAITLQSFILAANSVLLYKGIENTYLIISGVLVLSLFSLQVTSRRFLMFYPYQQFMERPTPKADTCILRCFIAFSIFFLIMGVLAKRSPLLQNIDNAMCPYICYLIPFLVPILPILWHFKFENTVRNSIVQDLKSSPTEYTINCPQGSCGFIEAKVQKSIISNTKAKITIDCPKCNHHSEQLKPVIIGY